MMKHTMYAQVPVVVSNNSRGLRIIPPTENENFAFKNFPLGGWRGQEQHHL